MSDMTVYSDVLRNLVAAYESRIKNLSEIRNITLELKYAVEDEEERGEDDSADGGAPGAFDEILTRREIKIDEQGIIATTINHYKSELPSDVLGAVNSAERGAGGVKEDGGFIGAIKKITAAEKIIFAEIRAAENFNLEHMKKLMDEVKKKLDNIKKNRIIMDRFVNGSGDLKTGALMNKKK